MMKRVGLPAALAALLLAATAMVPKVQAQGRGQFNERNGIRRVLLVSIDGMHVVDFTNCAQGISTINGGEPYCPNLAALGTTGVNYLQASTSKPSDSFPGLTAIVTGGSPRAEGVFYDVAYDRSLAPPATDTGNGLLHGTCRAGVFNGTSTEYEEGIDKNQLFVNGIDGVSTSSGDGGINSIDPSKLPRDPAKNCSPVFPWNFVRTNTIFGVIHDAGGFAAWSDKHPAYSSVAGPGSVPVPSALDDYYSPEINSAVVGLSNVVGLTKVVTPLGLDCTNPPDGTQLGSWTDSFQNIQCYDTLKVQAILNEIDGFNHSRTYKTQVPTIFGMNFQAVSVGQKLIEKGVGSGGYLDATGTPSALLLEEMEFVDASIGKWVAELKKEGLYGTTLIVITAKHGQSPIDSQRYTGITSSGPVTSSPSQLVDNCLPASESNAGGQIGPTEDDVSLLWLSSCDTLSTVQTLETQSPESANIAGIGQIFYGTSLAQMFNTPGLPPDGDPRTPDIVITPNIGVTYSGSHKKQAEHGGFSHDDTNVMMLLSNPRFRATTVNSPVETTQVAPTILEALGVEPNRLQAVRLEGTQILPGISFKDNRE
jgi:type I phosphodiesterase/nucleotide pyrophosphatase